MFARLAGLVVSKPEQILRLTDRRRPAHLVREQRLVAVAVLVHHLRISPMIVITPAGCFVYGWTAATSN